MKQMRIFCLLAILAFAVGAFAQGGNQAPSTPAHRPQHLICTTGPATPAPLDNHRFACGPPGKPV